MATRKVQGRYNAEMKKAILLSESYDEYKTMVQFLQYKLETLKMRRERYTLYLQDFLRDGGRFEYDKEEGRYSVSIGDVALEVWFDEGGRVTDIHSINPDSELEVRDRLYGTIYASGIMQYYDTAIESNERDLANLENDRLLQSITNASRTMAKDIYITAGAVTGLDLRTQEDVDPFDILREDE